MDLCALLVNRIASCLQSGVSKRAAMCSGGVTPAATVRLFRTVQPGGGRDVTREVEHYNLDMMLALGFRVHSPVGVRHIELNPVRAAMVVHPSEYPWSSYHHNALSQIFH